uniref:4631405J19Rik protein n=1 Tax=Mus musculus TaxID=10090 RepID=Q498A6_MOUSE|nr:4631405J19Rik protein [Mus musculus]
MKTTKTSSKQTCLGSSELPILLPSEFTGEGESAPRGYLGNYRDATKQDLNPDPLISSPQAAVSICGTHEEHRSH